MKNNELAKKIKELRNRKGISQEELSEKSGLSLRTIQRIENGETEPRGDSLKRLASTFNVSPDEITDWQIVEDNTIVNLLSLTQFSFLVFPILGVLVPLVIWISKKDKIKNVDKIGKAIINFQITWTIVVFISYLFWFILRMGPLFMIGLYVFNLLMITVNSIRINNIKEVYYKPAFKILR
ncbi:helix-turn-helix domain-containing protein [uncultured Cyclobacterium sp.]|uniref:helix-turn-helix domain-containing protein n=1 Tax=uncultured Cyclobacterium sp. TaxID=453820 RepID=UPI0030EF7CFC|tara:strand:+ start:188 stop:730 length:543 start_codon:yes stop_codon:yes gene_type:complete